MPRRGLHVYSHSCSVALDALPGGAETLLLFSSFLA